MESMIIVVHVLAAIGITGLVLIQHGKGADMGASFGSGASQTIFGSVGTGNALTKTTTWLAVIFFITSLTLALFAKQQAGQSVQDDSLIQNTDVLNQLVVPPAQQDVPAVPGDGAASDVPSTEGLEAALPDAANAATEENAAQAAEQTDAEPVNPEAEAATADDLQDAPGN
jgi:preprotein translocase subunit SecG